LAFINAAWLSGARFGFEAIAGFGVDVSETEDEEREDDAEDVEHGVCLG
jgi:hypothetical protein